MNIKQTAKERRVEAKRLEEQVAQLRAAADILDPPKPPKHDRAAKARAALAAKRAAETAPAASGRSSPVRLDLRTAGRAAHPSDPDARALRERLAYTTEGAA